jgi:hypothetical protein
MHHHPNPRLADDAFDAALLALLTHDHDGLWSVAELSRSMTSSARPSGAADPETEDAIERLHADGLIHRVGEFVFASRAAHAAQRLAG